jgi:glutamate N-acetyltransferase / amino-acid N-acetyltransferase
MTPGAGIFRTNLPLGFSAGGVNCGVRHYRPDLGAIISEKECVVTAVYTQNAYKAAPIQYCESILPAANIKALVTNSGQANALTGELGIINNKKMADALAKELACDGEQVLTASTGVIGEQMSIYKITKAMPALVKSVSSISENFAVAILTTDLVPKTVKKEVELSNGTVTITGICKGSGMIHPNMATMLGYFLTDASLTIEQSQAMLKKSCDKSFNMISVDGDSSTNDCVFMMSNGMSDVTLDNESDISIFYAAIDEMAIVLAKSIARDGEGASKLIEVNVSGISDELFAKKIARSITTSPLIKTAIYGESPNWGRILGKIGSEAGSNNKINHCNVSIQGITVFAKDLVANNNSLEELSAKMKNDTIEICVQFFDGDKQATAWGCDLTEKYVQINADYLS